MELLLKDLRPFITNYIKTFIESNTTPSKQIIIKKKYETSKIGINFFGSEIENDPIIIYYVDPNKIGYENGLRIGQHITKIGVTKVAGTEIESVRKKVLSHKDLNITYKEGTDSIPYTETGDGIGKTDINEKDLITVKDDNDQEIVLLVKPEKTTQKNNQQNKFSACVIKKVEIKEQGKEQGKEKGKEEDSGYITKVELEEKLRNKENRSNDDLIFTIIKDPNFTLFNYLYRMYTENNNNKENLHVFFNYNAGANDTLGLGTDENLVITQVDAKKFGTSFKEGDKIKEVEGSGIFSIDAYKDKATELKKTPGIKYITVKSSKIMDKNITSESTKKIIEIEDRDIVDNILSRLYHVGDNEVFSFSKKLKSEDKIILDSIFIHAIEIVYNNKQSSILEKEQMKYDEIQKILQEFRNMDKYNIEKENIKVAIAYTVDKEKANKLYKRTSTIGNIANNSAGRYLKNKLKRKFNSTFGLNSKNIAIEKASKLYETYIQFFILKNYEEEKEKINEFFKTNQLYKRLAKKFVLTQTAKYSYNENNIFSKDIEKIAELFHDVDIQDKIKKDIDKNVGSNDKDISNKKMYNYIGFSNTLSEIVALKNSITNDEDYKIILQIKENSIGKQLDNLNFNNEKINKTFEEYKNYVVNKSIEKILDPEKMLQEIFDKSGLLKEYQEFVKQKKREEGEGGEGEGEERKKIDINPLQKVIKFFADVFLSTEQLNELIKEKKEREDPIEDANKELTEVVKTEGEGEGEEREGGEEEREEGEGEEEEGKQAPRKDKEEPSNTLSGGELNFNKEKRSSSNINFSLNEIDAFIHYFKTITYDFKKLITDSIGNNKDKTINSFMNKYLNILIGEKIKDNLSETNDGVIEKYKKGIINPEFLTEKIGSIDSYNDLANTLMKTDDGIVKNVLDSLRPNKPLNNSGTINIIKFELIKNDLMNMVIEHVTNINLVKDIVMKDNFVSMLEERFQNKFNSKIGKTQQEKEVSSETKQLLDSIFALQSSDSKTIQNYKKQLREIDNIIENKAKTETLDFVNVFTAINDKQIFNTKFELDTNGITINLGDGVNLQDAKEQLDNSEKEKILKLLADQLFSQSSINLITKAFDEKPNAEETRESVTEETPA
tara:strand:- start:5889 stop:9248 length:3360 start_codon:yes stop_codon:yes gene_type:complete